MNWRCPKCGYPNPNSLNRCFKCSGSRDLGETVQPEPPPPVSQQPVQSAQPAQRLAGAQVASTQGIATATIVIGLIVWFVLDLNVWPGGSRQVRYEVTGTASMVLVTYTDANGGILQDNGTPVPWEKSFDMKRGAFTSVSAQNQDASGEVTVTIYVDGSVFRTSTSTGGYAIAMADGSL